MPQGRWHVWRGTAGIARFAALIAVSLLAVGCVRQSEQGEQSPPPSSGKPPLVSVRVAPRSAALTVAVHCGYRVLAGRDGRRVLDRVTTVLTATTAVAEADGIRLGAKKYAGDAIEIVPDYDGHLKLGVRHYRGSIQLVRDGGGLIAVNVVDMEKYLRGVVPSEVPSHWKTACLRTQAVAARTYALYRRMLAPKHRAFELYDGQNDQVYRGCDAETAATNAAVRETRGVVLTYKGRVFKAYFSSTCGGVTANCNEVLGYRRIEPLAGGVKCPDCRLVASPEKFAWGTVAVDKAGALAALKVRYSQAFRGFRSPYRVTPLGRSVTGGPVWLDFADAAGHTARVRAGDFRLVVGPGQLRSVNATVVDTGERIEFRNGRGWGHGVGLCQCGAEGMARKGAKYTAILARYYPGSRLARVY